MMVNKSLNNIVNDLKNYDLVFTSRRSNLKLVIIFRMLIFLNLQIKL